MGKQRSFQIGCEGVALTDQPIGQLNSAKGAETGEALLPCSFLCGSPDLLECLLGNPQIQPTCDGGGNEVDQRIVCLGVVTEEVERTRCIERRSQHEPAFCSRLRLERFDRDDSFYFRFGP